MIRDGIRRAFHLAARGRHRWEREVEDEIKLHLALRAEQLMAQGASPDAAYDEAVRRFGPLQESRARLVDAARHRERKMQRTEYFADLRQDLSFALRTLRRDAGWTSITVLTLALGIAATTAVFSVVSSLLLHAVAYPDAKRIVLVQQQPMQANTTGIHVSMLPGTKTARLWKTARSFEDLEAYSSGNVNMKTTGAPAQLTAAEVEPSFAHFAGSAPLIGRMFDDPHRALSREVMLGEGVWRSRFGGDRGVIGKAITLDDSLYTIVGVLPAKLQLPRVGQPATDVWLPMDTKNDSSGAALVGRLRRDANAEMAARELDTLSARESGQLRFRASIIKPSDRLPFRDSLIMLSVSVALVLLVACANVAHLLLARSTSRRRELAIRVALGAGRGRVFRQLLTESVVLSVAGAVLGVLGGWLTLEVIIAARPQSLPELVAAHLDRTTLGIALVFTVATSLVFGLLGAVQAARESTHETLKSGATRVAGGHGHARQMLVITEMALSATLVVGATMLVRSMINLQNADLGFQPNGLFALSLSRSNGGNFLTQGDHGAAYRAIASRLKTMPGVESVAMTANPPTWFSFSIGRLEVDGEPAPNTPATAFINVNQVGSGYFQTMGIRLVEGTFFTDTTPGAGQVILNERFVRKQWGGASPLGKRIRVSQKGQEPWLTVVGVVKDAATGGPTLATNTAPLLYTAAADSNARAIIFHTTQTADLLKRLQGIAKTVDPTLTPKLDDIQSSISKSLDAPRFVMLLLTTFTAIGLALAAIGLYGVMAYTVAQRTREIGIRVALGATRARIARGVVIGAVTLSVLGCVLGALASMWGSKIIQTQLYGVEKHDVVSMIASLAVLLATAVAASVVPVRRAIAVDPMTAIRAE